MYYDTKTKAIMLAIISLKLEIEHTYKHTRAFNYYKTFINLVRFARHILSDIRTTCDINIRETLCDSE